MEKIIITIDTVNAAFDDEPATEIARILHKLADDLEQFDSPDKLFDANGNAVGTVFVDSWSYRRRQQ